MADKKGQYSTKTNTANAMKPTLTNKLSGNFMNMVERPPVENINQQPSESILKNSMSKMFVDDFWTMFEKNSEKLTKNPIVPKDPFLPGTAPQFNRTGINELYEKSRVEIERTKDNIYNTTSKSITLQEKFKELPQPTPPMQTPHATAQSGGRGAGGGGNNVTINNMATIDQVTIAAVMLPLWRQGFVG